MYLRKGTGMLRSIFSRWGYRKTTGAVGAGAMVLTACVACASGVGQAEDKEAPQALAAKDHVKAVREVFANKCSGCHKPSSKNRYAKKRWKDWHDLEQLKTRYILEDGKMPSDVKKTELWDVLTTDDKEHAMPPKKAKTGPLSEVQLTTILQWLKVGAPTE